MISKLVCLLIITSSTTFVVSYGNQEIADALIDKYAENRELLERLNNDGVNYDTVFPVQLRDKNVRTGIDTRNYNPLFRNGTFHYESSTFSIKTIVFGKIKIHLQLNRFLLPIGAQYAFVANESYHQNSGLVENCYYQGEVQNDPHSFVALSTCAGLNGVIVFENITYIISALKGGDLSRQHPHFVYKAFVSSSTNKANCGNTGNAEWDFALDRKFAYDKRRNKRDANQVTKYIELAVIVDHSLTKTLNQSANNVLNHLAESLNIVDLIFQSLNTRISLVYAEAWLEAQPQRLQLSAVITDTLLNVLDYNAHFLYTKPKDMILFLTSRRFKHQTITMGASGAICGTKSVGVIRDTYIHDVAKLSVIMSHTIGHIVGLKHEVQQTYGREWEPSNDAGGSNVCNCDENGCIMNEMVLGKKSAFAHRFSSCSRDEYSLALSGGHLGCLFNQPLQPDTHENCGNKVIDDGEQCDCGSIEECEIIDPCCDPNTCTLRAGSECATGPCCNRNCKLKPYGLLCRNQTQECDAPEFCDGKSGQCPADGYKMNGVECGGREGYCYLGRCTSATSQCAAIWGPNSVNSNGACYMQFNGGGAVVPNGNCGSADTSDRNSKNDQPCNNSDAFCGKLQCSGGREELVGRSFVSLKFTSPSNPNQLLHCKTVTPPSNDTFGFAEDGTKCGPNMICIKRSCVALSVVTPEPQCPSNNVALQCSGHGVCTNLNVCFCDVGWTGTECGTIDPLISAAPPLLESEKVAETPSTVGPPSANSRWQFDKDLYNILIILGGATGAVVITALFCVFCYRRTTKSILSKKQKFLAASAAYSREYEKESESSVDTAGRSIKFGSLPSYRNEKQKQKHSSERKQSRNLRKIPEEQDERSHTSEQSMEQHQPLLCVASNAYTAEPTASSCATTQTMPPFQQPQQQNQSCLNSSNSSRESERTVPGILKNYITLPVSTTACASVPLTRASTNAVAAAERCRSEVNGATAHAPGHYYAGGPNLTPLSSRRNPTQHHYHPRSDGYESDTYASHLMLQLRYFPDSDFSADAQQLPQPQDHYALNNSNAGSHLPSNASRCDIVDTSVEHQPYWTSEREARLRMSGPAYVSPYMGLVRSSRQASFESDATLQCNSSNGYHSDWPMSLASASPRSSRSQRLTARSNTHLQQQPQKSFEMDELGGGQPMLAGSNSGKSRSRNPNNDSHASSLSRSNAQNAQNLLIEREMSCDRNSSESSSQSAPDAEDAANIGAVPSHQKKKKTDLPRAASPANSVASSGNFGKKGFMSSTFPVPVLENINRMLKEFDCPEVNLSPASSTELSVPEADKPFRCFDLDSNTESNVAIGGGGLSDLYDFSLDTPVSGGCSVPQSALSQQAYAANHRMTNGETPNASFLSSHSNSGSNAFGLHYNTPEASNDSRHYASQPTADSIVTSKTEGNHSAGVYRMNGVTSAAGRQDRPELSYRNNIPYAKQPLASAASNATAVVRPAAVNGQTPVWASKTSTPPSAHRQQQLNALKTQEPSPAAHTSYTSMNSFYEDAGIPSAFYTSPAAVANGNGGGMSELTNKGGQVGGSNKTSAAR